MAVYKYPGYETGQAWTMKPGNLKGGFWGGPISKYWGRSPQIPIIFPQYSGNICHSAFGSLGVHAWNSLYGCLSFVIVHGIGWSFGIIIKPLRAFKSQSQKKYSKDGGRPSAAPPWLVWFNWLWLLKALKRLYNTYPLLPSY